jgi:PHD-finger
MDAIEGNQEWYRSHLPAGAQKPKPNPQPVTPSSYQPSELPDPLEFPNSEVDDPLESLSSVSESDAELEPAVAIVSCQTCGVAGEAAKETLQCDLCKLRAHVACIEESELPPTFSRGGGDYGVNHRWSCSECLYTPGGRWDQVM